MYRLLARLYVLESPLTYRGLGPPAKVCVLWPPGRLPAPRLRSQELSGVRSARAQGTQPTAAIPPPTARDAQKGG